MHRVVALAFGCYLRHTKRFTEPVGGPLCSRDVVFYNGGGQEYGMSTGRGTVANTAQVEERSAGSPIRPESKNVP